MRRWIPALVLLAGTAPPDAAPLGHAPGSVVRDAASALAVPYRPLNVQESDRDGDGWPEEAVLFGHPTPGGVAQADGLLVLSRTRRGARIVGAALLAGHPNERYSLGEAAVDLDGDGVGEILIVSRLVEAGVERTVHTWWSWKRGAGDPAGGAVLRPLHRSEVLFRDAGVPGVREPVAVRRSVKRLEAGAGGGPARLRERVERRGGGGPAIVHELVYRQAPGQGRFVLDSIRLVHSETEPTERSDKGAR